MKVSELIEILQGLDPDGSVYIVSREGGSSGEDEPELRQFLGFLSRDIADHPENLQAIDAGWVQRIQSLTGVIEVDLDAPLSADDE
jgi:antitoxin PrlF